LGVNLEILKGLNLNSLRLLDNSQLKSLEFNCKSNKNILKLAEENKAEPPTAVTRNC